MNYTATITSKRQLTIPAELFVKMGLVQGEKVEVREKEGVIEIEPAILFVNRLAGSLNVPKKYRGLSENQIIKIAKREYLMNKHS